MGRAPCCDKANVKKGPWSPEEDAKLKDYIENYGTGSNWIALPQKIGLKRCGKSCRLRWLNYLRPNIKHGGFSEEEDNIICSLYISIGSRWSIIAAQLPGRTDNDIKNYWNTRLKKKLLGRRKQYSNNINELISSSGQDSNCGVNGKDDNNTNQYSQGLSNSAIERLQLHMQFQSLQNPFSFFNNSTLWPKLHPVQEKMIQNLQSLNKQSCQSPNSQNVLHSSQLGLQQNVGNFFVQSNSPPTIPEDFPHSNCSVPVSNTDDMPKANGFDLYIATNQDVSTLQAELESFLNNNKAVRFTAHEENQIGQFDCFDNASNGSNKDSLIWWENEFDSKSASSNSWDSTPVLHHHQSEGMFQDVELGYNL